MCVCMCSHAEVCELCCCEGTVQMHCLLHVLVVHLDGWCILYAQCAVGELVDAFYGRPTTLHTECKHNNRNSYHNGGIQQALNLSGAAPAGSARPCTYQFSRRRRARTVFNNIWPFSDVPPHGTNSVPPKPQMSLARNNASFHLSMKEHA